MEGDNLEYEQDVDVPVVEDQEEEYNDADQNVEDGDTQILVRDDDGDQPIEVQNDSVSAFTQHEEPVFCVSAHPSKDIAVTGGQDDRAFVWKIENGETIATFDAHKDSITQVGFNGDGKYIATGSMDGSIRVWDSESLELIIELDCGDDLTSMAWHPKGPFLVASTAGGTMNMWHIPSGNMSFFAGHQDVISQISWSHSGRQLASCGEDGQVLVWSPKTQSIVTKFDNKTNNCHENCVGCLAWHPDDAILASGDFDGKVKLLNTTNGKVVKSFELHQDNIEWVGFSASKPITLGIASLDGNVSIVATDTQAHLQTLEHPAGVIKAAWLELNIITACLDAVVRLWDARQGLLLRQFQGHCNHIMDLTLTHSKNRFISTSEDGSALVFDLKEQEEEEEKDNDDNSASQEQEAD